METINPNEFLEGTKNFLKDLGLRDLTKISIDEKPLHFPEASAAINLQQAIDLGLEHFKQDHSSVRTIKITSIGEYDEFSLILNSSYFRKHLPEEAPIRLEVTALPKEWSREKGESHEDYRIRMNALDSDVKKSQEAREAIKERKKKLYSDFANKLSDAFPGIKLELYEMVSPEMD
jgi:hypothetical protein